MSEPKGLKTIQDVKCPNCGVKYRLKIVVTAAKIALMAEYYDQKGKPIYEKPIFSPRVVA